MATSAIPAAIDYLVAAITALPECALPVIVEDGWPTRSAPVGVGIGVIPGDGTTDTEVVHAQLGAQMERERFEIPGIVWAHIGGTSAKTARDMVFGIYNAVVTKVRQDRTLGGALHSGAAIVALRRLEQTDTAAEGGDGRMCEARFVVVCDNRF